MKQYSTRKWRHPEGYKYLAPWTNAVLLRFLIRKLTPTLPRSEYRMKTQIDDAARSVVANIEEGYKRPTTKEYLEYLGFSQGSLEEFKGKLEEDKGNSPLEVLYAPLNSFNGRDLTFEMFLELANKTDFLLRRLVSSLEQNIAKEETMSPYEKWLAQHEQSQRENQEEFDKELKKIMNGDAA